MPDALTALPSAGGAPGRPERWAARSAVGMSAAGFLMSRGYRAVAGLGDFVLLDYFLATSMTLTHVGFVLAIGLLARPLRDPGARPEQLALPAAAAFLACLTFLWVP